MIKRVVAIACAGAVTAGLFLFMGSLVAPPSELVRDGKSGVAIEFVRVREESRTETRNRQLPKKPQLPKPPDTPKIVHTTQQTAAPADLPSLALPPLDLGVNFAGGPYIGEAAGPGSGDQDAVPLVRIEPQYPRKAAMDGKEGWVELSFDIDPSGQVVNVAVLRSEPKRLFESAARSALLKWKYRPKLEDGEAVPRPGNKVRIDFKLEGH